MDFVEVIKQARALLQSEGRMTYRTLKRQFALDDESLDDLKFELIEGQEVAADKDGKILVWTGGETQAETAETATQAMDVPTAEPPASAPLPQPAQEAPAGERRQLTVMFCDLVGSTALSEQLDPEDLQTVVKKYQEVCAQVIERYEGYIAQYLGDGLLVYFGYPVAHEDDAARAIRTGLEIVSSLDHARNQFPQPVQVRIGIHSGLVVVGQMGGGMRHEQLALGEAPNIAARVQGHAEPDTVVISAATRRLVAGLFETADQGRYELKGISTPQSLYRVTAESAAQSRFEVAVRSGLTPLVGRDGEVQLLQSRWAQATQGAGQVVCVSGEPGIGKSRLVQELKAKAGREGAIPIEFRCSPYYQNSALYPVTEHLQRLLQFVPADTPETKLDKLQQTLSTYRFPQPDTVSLLATLLSLPVPTDAPPLTASPEKQKEQTQEALVAWLVEEAQRQVVYNAWEDLHWADPSTLEFLNLFLPQVPTTRLLTVLTYRPEFTPSWGTHSYISQLTLSRLGREQVEGMVERVTGGKALPEEVVEQIATKTDGVPLFVEELTKMVMESELVLAVNSHYELTGPLPPLAIPSTLQDSLMARLDRLASVKDVAQLGATLGREFSYELIHAVSPLGEETLQQGLQQLVDAEFVYQRGLPPQVRYLFKHALIQETAYESLLKSRRQQLHQQVAQVLEQQFAETVETQPELIAHHYTEAGLNEQAIPYWQQAGELASKRSAYVEAISHLTKGLEVLNALPDTPERAQQELSLHTTLGQAFAFTKGFSASEVEDTYSRALELSRRVGETPQLFELLVGLWVFYHGRRDFQTTGRELAEQMMRLAQNLEDPGLLLAAHLYLGLNLYWGGEFASARTLFERGMSHYDPQRPPPPILNADSRLDCLLYGSYAVWHLGYPDQALKACHEALALAEGLSHHPYTVVHALAHVASFHVFRREWQLAQERAESIIAISTEQGFPFWVAGGAVIRGWALAEQGQAEEGIAQLRDGLAFWQTIGAELSRVRLLFLLVAACAKVDQLEEGLSVLAEALEMVDTTAEHWNEAELYRLKGDLLLAQARKEQSTKSEAHISENREPQSQILDPQGEAEACFLKAIEVARHQQAKSLELRTSVSLARLWQGRGKKQEALALLAPVYDWFTEGFDTQDLKDAKALLDGLS